MKIALVSALLDDGYGQKLDDKFMEEVVCQEDHSYHRIAHTLTIRNHKPTVFYVSSEKKIKRFAHKYGHEIIRVPVKKLPFFHEPLITSPKLIKQIITNFDVCHIVSGYYVMYKVPDMFDYTVKKLHNTMPIIARWAGGNHKWLFPIRKTIKKKSLKKCDKIICAGKDEIKVLKNIFDIPNSKIEYMINPHDLSIFKKTEKIDACTQLKLSTEKRYFLYVGRFTINKGIEHLLDIFNELKFSYPDVDLILIGDGPLREKILEFIKKNKLEDRISIKGRQSHLIISQYYNACTILFHIGISGGLPNVIVEGIASGIPIIASKNNANIDFVNDNLHTGKIIKAGDDVQLKKAIKEILENPKEFNYKIPEIIKECSYEFVGEKLERIFKQCIDKIQ